MANPSIHHFDSESYLQIKLKDLENVHLKVNQCYSILSILTDWVAETGNCSLSPDQRNMVESIFLLLTKLMKGTKNLLPQCSNSF